MTSRIRRAGHLVARLQFVIADLQNARNAAGTSIAKCIFEGTTHDLVDKKLNVGTAPRSALADARKADIRWSSASELET